MTTLRGTHLATQAGMSSKKGGAHEAPARGWTKSLLESTRRAARNAAYEAVESVAELGARALLWTPWKDPRTTAALFGTR